MCVLRFNQVWHRESRCTYKGGGGFLWGDFPRGQNSAFQFGAEFLPHFFSTVGLEYSPPRTRARFPQFTPIFWPEARVEHQKEVQVFDNSDICRIVAGCSAALCVLWGSQPDPLPSNEDLGNPPTVCLTVECIASSVQSLQHCLSVFLSSQSNQLISPPPPPHALPPPPAGCAVGARPLHSKPSQTQLQRVRSQ